MAEAPSGFRELPIIVEFVRGLLGLVSASNQHMGECC